MEKESFEDSEVAELLNRYFVSVKVDREERPDIDSVYMDVTYKLTGSGGWPNSVFMDYNKKPVYAGTYFSKNDGRYGSGFVSLIKNIASLWGNNRQMFFEAANRVSNSLTEINKSHDIDYEKTIQNGFQNLIQSFDSEYGGFGTAPKFPSPHNLLFLLRYAYSKKDAKAQYMAETTLKSMYRGGIYDHIGFGFCRYSTDRLWLAPHFEKMLYDNALLATAYCEAYSFTKKPFYEKVAREIFTYINRNMTSDNGGFFSAEDADSEGVEGKFYTFGRDEVFKLLGMNDGEKFCNIYNITSKGNFDGTNIPNLISQKSNDTDEPTVPDEQFYEDCRKKLFDYREKRMHPFKDDKIIASWNGLMIHAFSYGGRVLRDESYIEKAKNAADFVLENMVNVGGRLLTRYRDGEAKYSAVADDYACMVWGLTSLYESTFEKRYLLEALRLNDILIEDFWKNGALYQNGKNSEPMISRPREIYDGAMPSYNSISINNFIKLSHILCDNKLKDMAEEIILFFGADIDRMPHAHTFSLCGLMALNGEASKQIIFAGDENSEFINVINDSYTPFSTMVRANDLMDKIDFYKVYTTENRRSAIYICENNTCKPAIFDITELKEALK